MNNLVNEYENFLNKDLSIIIIAVFEHAGSDVVQGLLDNKKFINCDFDVNWLVKEKFY